MAAQPSTQQTPAVPNSTIIYPTVPQHEEDPAARVNVMIAMFNNSLRGLAHNGTVDVGFAHEILTARYLLESTAGSYNAGQRGCHISRPLTTKEKAAGLKGDSQLVKVPMEGGKFRELDMVFFDNRDGAGGMLTIVEAKSMRYVDHHQMGANVELARRVGGKVIYSIDRPGQEGKLQAAYRKIAATQGLPPFEVIVPTDENDRFVCRWNDPNMPRISITKMYTQMDKLRDWRLERPELYEAENTEEGMKYVYIGLDVSGYN